MKEWYVELLLQADNHSQMKAFAWQSDNNIKLHTHVVGGAVQRSPGSNKKSTVERRLSLWLTRSPEGSRERWRQTAAMHALRFKDRFQRSKR